MNSTKTFGSKKRRGLRIALSVVGLTGLTIYLSCFIAFHQNFDPFLKEDVQKQMVRLSNIENLASRDGPGAIGGRICENGEEIYSFLFRQAGFEGPLLSLSERKESGNRLYQAQWNGETEASEFHFLVGDELTEKSFRILTYKELLATFLSFSLDPEQFSYRAKMNNVSFDRNANLVDTTADYLPEEDWVFSLPRMGTTYSLSNPVFEFFFHPTEDSLAGKNDFYGLISGDCDGTEVKIYLDFDWASNGTIAG